MKKIKTKKNVVKFEYKNEAELVLITGATAGIGKETAKQFAAAGSDVVITGRRLKILKELKVEIENDHDVKVYTLCFDISNRKECEKIAKENSDLFSKVDVLVNNAGLASGADFIQDANLDDFEVMIDTNIKGLLYITRAVLPHMVKANRGHIVNLGSVAGHWVYPKGNVYNATKFAVRALSEGMRMDLLGTSIRVTNIAPGMVETEFSMVRLKDARKAKAVYEGIKPLSAADIAEAILWSVQRPAHVNIQEMIIFPTDQASVYHVNRK
jgi:3-hydroxy acid dehydrogenase / malonic semialdehyde reductase